MSKDYIRYNRKDIWYIFLWFEHIRGYFTLQFINNIFKYLWLHIWLLGTNNQQKLYIYIFFCRIKSDI